jgi:hypothetical protein
VTAKVISFPGGTAIACSRGRRASSKSKRAHTPPEQLETTLAASIAQATKQWAEQDLDAELAAFEADLWGEQPKTERRVREFRVPKFCADCMRDRPCECDADEDEFSSRYEEGERGPMRPRRKLR